MPVRFYGATCLVLNASWRMAQGLKGAIVGAVTKDGGKVTVQVVFIDADSARVALLPPTYF